MTDTSPTLTEAEQTALARLRAGTHVIVPQSALNWLDGAGPSSAGTWFHEDQESAENDAYRVHRALYKYWWRSVFRSLLKAAQEGK